MTFGEEIYEFDHFVRMEASVYIEHTSAGGWARNYKWFDLANVSTLSSYLLNLIKRFILLA